MTRRLPELLTVAQIVAETGLPESTIRSILRTLPKVATPTRTVIVRRRDFEAALQLRDAS